MLDDKDEEEGCLFRHTSGFPSCLLALCLTLRLTLSMKRITYVVTRNSEFYIYIIYIYTCIYIHSFSKTLQFENIYVIHIPFLFPSKR